MKKADGKDFKTTFENVKSAQKALSAANKYPWDVVIVAAHGKPGADYEMFSDDWEVPLEDQPNNETITRKAWMDQLSSQPGQFGYGRQGVACGESVNVTDKEGNVEKDSYSGAIKVKHYLWSVIYTLPELSDESDKYKKGPTIVFQPVCYSIYRTDEIPPIQPTSGPSPSK
jgi:hypothetical protein